VGFLLFTHDYIDVFYFYLLKIEQKARSFV